jgi:hypothetical protein
LGFFVYELLMLLIEHFVCDLGQLLFVEAIGGAAALW